MNDQFIVTKRLMKCKILVNYKKMNGFGTFWKLASLDDIFAIIKKDKLHDTLDHLNTLYPNNIKFTYETEEEN